VTTNAPEVAPPPPPPEFDWEAAGRELGASLDELNAVAVLGSSGQETALVALGIARQQARRRRVAIGDLLGESDPIQMLVAAPDDDDAHGIAEMFEHGVSLEKITRKIEGEKNLFVLPTGAFVTDESAMLTNRRWSALAAGFRDEKALLVVVASVESLDVEALVVQLDGAVIVGGTLPPRLPVSRVVGRVVGPKRRTERRSRRMAAPSRYVIKRGNRSLWRIGGMVGVALTAVIVAVGFWLASRPYAENDWAPAWLQGRGADAKRAVAFLPGMDSSGALPDSGLAIAPHFGMLTAKDSSAAAPYAIRLISFNTQAGALLELQRNGATLRAGTFTPVLIRESPWFRVVAGAYPDSVSAAALLDTLRERGLSDAGRAVIDRYPYALLVERDVPDSAVASRVSVYQTRGLPVYALLQSDGTARLFAGAFKEPEEASLLSDAMRASGVRTSVVYRTGRVY
jgi:hypothetical protein